MPLKLQFTVAGLTKCIDAANHGLRVEITHIAFGDQAYDPTQDQTQLNNEIERVEINDYQAVGQELRMAAVFDGALEYAIREIGVFLSDGTMLGVYSQLDRTLGYRTPSVKVVQWLTLNVSALPADSITVVIGSENLNLVLDAEFAAAAAVFLRAQAAIIKNSHWNMLLSERVRILESTL